MTYITTTPQETEALGEALAGRLSPGAVLALTGGLGITCRVTSPTYTIVNEYPGPLPLFHFDMYRLTGPEDLFDIGWEDYLERGGVLAVEWSERVREALEDPLTVSIRRSGGDPDRREITIEGDERFADLSL